MYETLHIHPRYGLNTITTFLLQGWVGSPRVVTVKALDSGIVMIEFEFLSRCYVTFWTNILGKGRNPFIPTSYGLNITTTGLLQR